MLTMTSVRGGCGTIAFRTSEALTNPLPAIRPAIPKANILSPLAKLIAINPDAGFWKRTAPEKFNCQGIPEPRGASIGAKLYWVMRASFPNDLHGLAYTCQGAPDSPKLTNQAGIERGPHDRIFAIPPVPGVA
jgi:hypothetical protein